MFEDLRVAAGQVILDEAMSLARTEEEQLELAVREHAHLVFRIAYSVLRNHHDAEDATQETFLRVMRARRKLSSVDDPQRWIARIAWRVAVEQKRKLPPVSLDEVASRLQSNDAPADEALMDGEISQLLERMIPALPRRLRDVVTLSTVRNLSSTDIASTLKISEAAVRSRLFRARQILKERLARLLEGNHGDG